MSKLSNNFRKHLEAEAFEVVVVKDNNLRPFLNVFQKKGQNIQQQKLGGLFGIIQVDDQSENSAYLPNLLTQIFKKEYYKDKNGDCGKSFEKVLYKVNLALAELVQHEIVEWINSLNAVIGIICENKIHFTQLGKGQILLLKDGEITSIDQEPKETQEYHPVKTFSTISSGKLKEGDKLIFTTQETFKTLHKKELERHLKTFNSDEFDNIVTSTLKNEASNTGMLIINMVSRKETVLENTPTPKTSEKDDLNFFGKKKKESKKIIKKEENSSEKSKDDTEFPQKTIDPNKSPFENEPEIYLKEKEDEDPESEEASINFSQQTTRLLKYFEKFKNTFPKKIAPLFKKGVNKIYFSTKQVWKKTLNSLFKKINREKISSLRKSIIKMIEKIKFIKTAGIGQFKKIKSFSKKSSGSFFKKISSFDFNKIKINQLFKKNKSSFEKDKIDFMNNATDFEKNEIEKEKWLKKFSLIFGQKLKPLLTKTKTYAQSITQNPSVKKISLVILTIIVLLIILILTIQKWKSSEFATEIINQNQSDNRERPEPRKEIANLKNLINLNKNIKDSTFLKNNLFLLTEEQSLIKFSPRNNKKTEILLPEKLKGPSRLSSIEALQLVFIIGSEQVYSYSPVTNSFSKNKFSFPENSEIIGAGTYLTYLYLLDQNSNQVYRYHRAPGGFGASQKWMKNSKESFEEATSLAISDSVYIAFENGKIQKYSQGKRKQIFNLEKEFHPDKIAVKINQKEVLALDKKEGRILKLLENSNQKEWFYDQRLKNANDFSVDFEGKKIFVVNEDNELVNFNY